VFTFPPSGIACFLFSFFFFSYDNDIPTFPFFSVEDQNLVVFPPFKGLLQKIPFGARYFYGVTVSGTVSLGDPFPKCQDSQFFPDFPH